MTLVFVSHPILAEATSFWTLVSNSVRSSSAVENSILLLLVVCSIASWAIVLWKIKAIRAARAGNARFGEIFDSAQDTDEVAAKLPSLNPSPNVLIYTAALLAVKDKSPAPKSAASATAIPINAAKGMEERVQMKMEHAGRGEFARLHRGMDSGVDRQFDAVHWAVWNRAGNHVHVSGAGIGQERQLERRGAGHRGGVDRDGRRACRRHTRRLRL
jgi:hypothetical protein